MMNCAAWTPTWKERFTPHLVPQGGSGTQSSPCLPFPAIASAEEGLPHLRPHLLWAVLLLCIAMLNSRSTREVSHLPAFVEHALFLNGLFLEGFEVDGV